MRITPRTDEVAAVVDLLESDTYDSAEALAKDVIKRVADLLSMRESYALTWITEGGRPAGTWAPYPSTSEAEKAAKHIGLGGRFRISHLRSSGVLMANATGNPGTKGYCKTADCGHAAWTHAAVAASRGACGLTPCTCPKFCK